jgi:hypothetical protein
VELRLDIYLVDGTYELFRHYYALPSARDSNGCEVAAVRGVLASVLGMVSSAIQRLRLCLSRRNDRCYLGGGLAWLLVGFLQFSDIEFFHLQKRVGHPRQFLLVFVLHHLVHDRRNDLP